MRFLIFFMLLIIPGISPNFAAATPDYLREDTQAYDTSPFASTAWNDNVHQGFMDFHAGKYDEAQKFLYQAFNKGCTSPIVLFQLALIAEYQKSFYSALDYYKMAEERFKTANKNHRYAATITENYARALYMSGKTETAWPLLVNAAKRSQSFWLLKLVGVLSIERGDTQNATSYFERAVRSRDENITRGDLIEIYTLLGRLFWQKGEKTGAIRSYSKVLEIDPNNIEAQNLLRSLRTKNNDQDDLRKMLEQLSDM